MAEKVKVDERNEFGPSCAGELKIHSAESRDLPIEASRGVSGKGVIPERIGIIAGWGDFPVRVAKSLKAAGSEVYATLLHGHADPVLREICDATCPVGLGKLGTQIRFFKKHNIRHVTMAGKVFKTVLFERYYVLKNLPDLTFLKYFARNLFSRSANRNDDALLLCVVRAFEEAGMSVESATELAPELLIGEGYLTRKKPSAQIAADISFGWELAKEMGRLDVGQSVVVQGRAAVAIEALEGTDECIKRAGELSRRGGFTVVKVAKPDQDMRFDVPTVGIKTLQNILDAGGRTLAIEADKTIVLDQQKFVDFANKNRMVVVSVGSEIAAQLLSNRKAS